MPTLIVRQIACPGCNAVLDVRCDACETCGAGTASDDATIRRRTRFQWIHHRHTMLLVLLGALGVLGIPLLWRSRAFTTAGKWLWSLVATIETAVLLGGCWWAIRFALDAYGQAAR